MGETLLELRGVRQEYGAFVAIAGVDLAVRDGELVALVGPSGCGKSTLLRIATGLQRPTGGQVLYRGAPLEGVNPRAAIVFQTFALLPWLTVQANVELALEAAGVGREERARRAVAALDRVGLDGFESAYPRELSGGMRQKAGFARALVVEPELLCLDEPFSALDVLSAEALRGELVELWTSGTMSTRAALLVTHSIEEAVLLADRIVVMDTRPGRVVHDLSVQLPRPRGRHDPEVVTLVDRVYALMAGQTAPEHIEVGGAPGQGRLRALPHVAVSALAGLLEHLAQRPERREDLYRLAADLHLDSAHLLALADAGEVLGLVSVGGGDAQLLPPGEAFAGADIQARKALFAERLRRLPLVGWLLALLHAADARRLERDVVEAALALDFPPGEARAQVDTLVRWCRYAELVAYDDRREAIYLEPAPAGG